MLRSLPSSFNASTPGPQALIVVGVDWCGHCQKFKPELKAMEPKLHARVYWVDGDRDKRATQWGVDGYPAIFYKASKGGLYKYNGQRSFNGIQRFIDSVEA